MDGILALMRCFILLDSKASIFGPRSLGKARGRRGGKQSRRWLNI
jgi:hypothetical protein